ncbi:hypothetical protein E2C01_035643 [Portunus trituberculatus]|uniref:Uncharacterized protein n=1 Tax=Portunus trituberculatus TaxID=210409 RepID=A0A5B7F9W6_PORTR|nr:hypothetical protein [Portunus trituberculatus]
MRECVRRSGRCGDRWTAGAALAVTVVLVVVVINGFHVTGWEYAAVAVVVSALLLCGSQAESEQETPSDAVLHAVTLLQSVSTMRTPSLTDQRRLTRTKSRLPTPNRIDTGGVEGGGEGEGGGEERGGENVLGKRIGAVKEDEIGRRIGGARGILERIQRRREEERNRRRGRGRGRDREEGEKGEKQEEQEKQEKQEGKKEDKDKVKEEEEEGKVKENNTSASTFGRRSKITRTRASSTRTRASSTFTKPTTPSLRRGRVQTPTTPTTSTSEQTNTPSTSISRRTESPSTSLSTQGQMPTSSTSLPRRDRAQTISTTPSTSSPWQGRTRGQSSKEPEQQLLASSTPNAVEGAAKDEVVVSTTYKKGRRGRARIVKVKRPVGTVEGKEVVREVQKIRDDEVQGRELVREVEEGVQGRDLVREVEKVEDQVQGREFLEEEKDEVVEEQDYFELAAITPSNVHSLTWGRKLGPLKANSHSLKPLTQAMEDKTTPRPRLPTRRPISRSTTIRPTSPSLRRPSSRSTTTSTTTLPPTTTEPEATTYRPGSRRGSSSKRRGQGRGTTSRGRPNSSRAPSRSGGRTRSSTSSRDTPQGTDATRTPSIKQNFAGDVPRRLVEDVPRLPAEPQQETGIQDSFLTPRPTPFPNVSPSTPNFSGRPQVGASVITRRPTSNPATSTDIPPITALNTFTSPAPTTFDSPFISTPTPSPTFVTTSHPAFFTTSRPSFIRSRRPNVTTPKQPTQPSTGRPLNSFNSQFDAVNFQFLPFFESTRIRSRQDGSGSIPSGSVLSSSSQGQQSQPGTTTTASFVSLHANNPTLRPVPLSTPSPPTPSRVSRPSLSPFHHHAFLSPVRASPTSPSFSPTPTPSRLAFTPSPAAFVFRQPSSPPLRTRVTSTPSPRSQVTFSTPSPGPRQFPTSPAPITRQQPSSPTPGSSVTFSTQPPRGRVTFSTPSQGSHHFPTSPAPVIPQQPFSQAPGPRGTFPTQSPRGPVTFAPPSPGSRRFPTSPVPIIRQQPTLPPPGPRVTFATLGPSSRTSEGVDLEEENRSNSFSFLKMGHQSTKNHIQDRPRGPQITSMPTPTPTSTSMAPFFRFFSTERPPRASSTTLASPTLSTTPFSGSFLSFSVPTPAPSDRKTAFTPHPTQTPKTVLTPDGLILPQATSPKTRDAFRITTPSPPLPQPRVTRPASPFLAAFGRLFSVAADQGLHRGPHMGGKDSIALPSTPTPTTLMPNTHNTPPRTLIAANTLNGNNVGHFARLSAEPNKGTLSDIPTTDISSSHSISSVSNKDRGSLRGITKDRDRLTSTGNKNKNTNTARRGQVKFLDKLREEIGKVIEGMRETKEVEKMGKDNREGRESKKLPTPPLIEFGGFIPLKSSPTPHPQRLPSRSITSSPTPLIPSSPSPHHPHPSVRAIFPPLSIVSNPLPSQKVTGGERTARLTVTTSPSRPSTSIRPRTALPTSPTHKDSPKPTLTTPQSAVFSLSPTTVTATHAPPPQPPKLLPQSQPLLHRPLRPVTPTPTTLRPKDTPSVQAHVTPNGLTASFATPQAARDLARQAANTGKSFIFFRTGDNMYQVGRKKSNHRFSIVTGGRHLSG